MILKPARQIVYFHAADRAWEYIDRAVCNKLWHRARIPAVWDGIYVTVFGAVFDAVIEEVPSET